MLVAFGVRQSAMAKRDYSQEKASLPGGRQCFAYNCFNNNRRGLWQHQQASFHKQVPTISYFNNVMTFYIRQNYN